MPVAIGWYFVLPGDVLGCMGDVWGVYGGIHGNWKRSDVFGGN